MVIPQKVGLHWKLIGSVKSAGKGLWCDVAVAKDLPRNYPVPTNIQVKTNLHLIIQHALTIV